MAEVKLHGFWYSPFTLRVIWTLKLKDIAYEYIEEDRFNKSVQLVEYNPVYKKTPVLVHNGKPICESVLIVEYIDEIWPRNSLVPAYPYEKALARFWVKYAEDVFSAVVAIFRSNNDEERENDIEKIWEHLRVVENQCFGDEKKLFGGDTINIVDIAFGSIFKFLELGEDIIQVKLLEDDKFPHLHSWYNNFKDIPVIKENLPDHDKMLHGFWYSPFTLRVVWTLKLKGIPYEHIEEDRYNKSPQLVEYNPVYKRTPVLVHAGKPICESMIIVEYIDQIWPQNPLLSAHSYERARSRFWVRYIDDMVSAVLSVAHSRNGEEQEKAIQKVWEHLRVMEDKCFSAQKKFFGGDTINIVDIAFGSIVKFLVIIEDAVEVKVLEDEKFPYLYSWYNNFKDIPVIKENLPDQDELVDFFKFYREKLLASS
ncbi:hypothetical protein CR513_46731 [Mucuna pruriens]|uniref:glutathione transferase n=1 Tax=Mucuna pruriens TaxID=157652 RepID=A0A371F5U0_MUCPR|nr:hypothetical protein CR513_46731 [Mucuna pruriens]